VVPTSLHRNAFEVFVIAAACPSYHLNVLRPLSECGAQLKRQLLVEDRQALDVNAGMHLVNGVPNEAAWDFHVRRTARRCLRLLGSDAIF
jgi:hypothetical protein